MKIPSTILLQRILRRMILFNKKIPHEIMFDKCNLLPLFWYFIILWKVRNTIELITYIEKKNHVYKAYIIIMAHDHQNPRNNHVLSAKIRCSHSKLKWKVETYQRI